ncbi:MAG: hypothetical protein JW807_14780 [Spirochaetes bacterium]|nr:hypothetical protein [Spirochaetota bacterium]
MTRATWISLFFCLALPLAGAALGAEEPAAPQPPDEKDYCAACHEGLAGSLKKPVAEWRGSVHAGAGNRCSLCHGGNPSAKDKTRAHSLKDHFAGKPDKKLIAEFCGKAGCHATALDQFRRGPHYRSVLKTGEPGCALCHGVHNIQRSSLDVMKAGSCAACHPAEYSKDMVALIAGFEKGIDEIDANIRLLSDKHAEFRDLQDRFNNMRHMFRQFVHVFSREDMESTRKILEMEIASLDSDAKSKVSAIQLMDVLYIVMLIFGLAIVIGIVTYTIVMYVKRKRKRKK